MDDGTWHPVVGTVPKENLNAHGKLAPSIPGKLKRGIGDGDVRFRRITFMQVKTDGSDQLFN